MAKKKQLNVIGLVFACLALVGLILAIVGMVTPIISWEFLGKSYSLGLFADGWANFEDNAALAERLNITVPSRAFTIIAFIVTLIGAVVVVADAVLKLLGKDVKFIGLCGGALAIVGGILVLVAGLVLAGQCNSFGEVMGMGKDIDIYGAAVGIWLGFIGGLVAGASGILSALKIGQK